MMVGHPQMKAFVLAPTSTYSQTTSFRKAIAVKPTSLSLRRHHRRQMSRRAPITASTEGAGGASESQRQVAVVEVRIFICLERLCGIAVSICAC